MTEHDANEATLDDEAELLADSESERREIDMATAVEVGDDYQP